jgi:ribosomal protein L17
MKEMEQLEQASACLEVVQNNQSHSFFKHRKDKLTTELKKAKEARQELQRLETSLARERTEANNALEKLMERALYHGQVVKLELPHVEVARDLRLPQNRAQKEAYVDLLLEILDDEQSNSTAYFVSEALTELQPLEKAYNKEQAEFLDANENYYRKVGEKDATMAVLQQRVREVKRFTRSIFGLRSREYQSIKDNMFRRKRPKPSDATEPDLKSPVLVE